MSNINDILFVEDIFNNFDADSLPLDVQGWGGHPEFFQKMIELSKPELILEVGTWKGKSAISMANILDSLNMDAKVMCIDTWLGATEFWADKSNEKRYKSLALKNGYPTVYYQFLANVVKSGHKDRIIPFPQSSINAARHLTKNGVKAQLIYIDGSHEYEDVKADIKSYYDLLSDDGIIFGDDYCEYWKGVKAAVNEFAEDKGLVLSTFNFSNATNEAPSDYWVLTKEKLKL